MIIFRKLRRVDDIKLNISKTCLLFGKTKQRFYQYEKYRKKEEELKINIISNVKQIRADVGHCGGRKLQHYLGKRGIDIGRDKLLDILRENNLLSKCYRKKVVTSDGKKSVYPNLLKHYSKPIIPGEILVSDITYLKTKHGHLYLSLTNDLKSNTILGYSLEKDLGTQGPVKAFKMALKKINKEKLKIHHSDKGSQYTSNWFQSMLSREGIDVSMTGAGKCYDNAVAERINGVLKTELSLNKIFSNYEESLSYVKSAISIYNNKRVIRKKDYKTPNEIFHEAKCCG